MSEEEYKRKMIVILQRIMQALESINYKLDRK